MEILIAILSGGAAVAMIEGIREGIARRYERRARKEAQAERNIEQRLTFLHDGDVVIRRHMKSVQYLIQHLSVLPGHTDQGFQCFSLL